MYMIYVIHVMIVVIVEIFMTSVLNVETQTIMVLMEKTHLFLSLIHISEPTRPY